MDQKYNSSLLLVTLLCALLTSTECSEVQCEIGASRSLNRFALSQRQILVDTIYKNVDLIVDGADGSVSMYISSRGSWQGKNLRTMARFIKEGDTIINVGSHIGIEAVVLGKIIGDKGRIFIFQPYTVSFNMMLKNIHLNGLASITRAYNVGGSNQVSKGYIAVSTANTGGSEIYTNETIARAPVRTEEVQVDLVDDMLPNGTQVDFALIDVERMELECLQGMKQTIKRSPNIVILCEWSGYSKNTPKFHQRIVQLIYWFEEMKFKFYQLNSYSGVGCGLEPFIQLTKEQVIGINSLQDIYFIPEHIDPNQTK